MAPGGGQRAFCAKHRIEPVEEVTARVAPPSAGWVGARLHGSNLDLYSAQDFW